MNTFKSFIYAFSLAALTALFVGCNDDDAEDTPTAKQDTFYSEKRDLGNGTVKTVVKLDANDNPAMLGVIFTEEALEGLPHEMQMLDLSFPSQAAETPFIHLGFDWQPHGHEPEGVYNVPHFDIHFYMMSMEDRMNIGVNDSLSEKLPNAVFMPASFIALPGSVPMMGKHWIDPGSPELQGAPFTQTFLMGSYNENVTFYEPMITVDYFEQKTSELIEIPQPAEYQQNGKYYPTAYRISYSEASKEYLVSLEGFVLR